MSGWQFVVILIWFGLAGGFVGRRKGGSFALWFLISFCMPVIGLLTAIVARSENRELRRQCPDCGKVVKLHDAVCTRCGTELQFPEVAILSEAEVRERRRSEAAVRERTA
ncbi:MAG: hypothetical protein QOJ25_1981 [Solirubrobacteraceae bacterium]|nr:hypothetical protein [Solirubrobacteraceae bacterium]